MKDIRYKLIELLKTDYATPQIARLAKKLKEPSSTLHYNLKKLENSGIVKSYKAVFNHKLINQGFCAFLLINLSPSEYGDPERIANELINLKEIESINIITGDWELFIKLRTKNQEEYYAFVKNVISRKTGKRIASI